MIEDLKIIEFFHQKDNRGEFKKPFSNILFNKSFDIQEYYFSINEKNVLRGMHLQNGEFSHDKIVYVTQGEILDVVIDLRKNSNSFKNKISIKLSDQSNKLIFIPKGCAHGFLSLKPNTIVNYFVTSVYEPNSEGGVNPLSIDFNWNCANPIISKRDLNLPNLNDL
jgi:dTDP-4-dehydrorhamnose 3,5-epimerase